MRTWKTLLAGLAVAALFLTGCNDEEPESNSDDNESSQTEESEGTDTEATESTEAEETEATEETEESLAPEAEEDGDGAGASGDVTAGIQDQLESSGLTPEIAECMAEAWVASGLSDEALETLASEGLGGVASFDVDDAEIVVDENTEGGAVLACATP